MSTAIGFAVLLIPAIVMYMVGYSEFSDGERADTLLEVVYAIYLINFWGIGYYAIGWSRWSTTVGKRIFNLYVVRTDGSKIGFWRALARCLCYHISGFPLAAGFLLIAFRKDKRGLHDLMCDTMVVIRR